MARRLVVVRVPGDKRAVALDAAIARAGLPEPVTVSWADALRDPARVGVLGSAGDLLRVESPGSDAATWHALARLGGFDGTVEDGEWRPGRAWFRGLSQVLRAIESGAPQLHATHPVAHILAMTDKVVCREVLSVAGVAIPRAFGSPSTIEELRALLETTRRGRVFIKPRWGSSGAGVLAYCRSGGREQLIASTALRAGRLVNEKTLHTYDDRASIDRLVSTVLEDGAIVEQWIPKAGFASGPFDLRVLVVDGAVAQRVARVGRGTVTNLHLGAARADADALLSSFGASSTARTYEICLRAAAAFPGHRCVGVDVMLDTRGRPFVLECNAWGDYLPRLLIEGRDSYDMQMASIAREAA